MSSASNSEWKVLSTADHGQSPRSHVLFFKFTRLKNGLEFHVTDLAHIWHAAKTSKEDLRAEAARTRCSIDPSEDEEQYDVLLSTLEDAVSGLGEAHVGISPLDEEEDDVRGGFEIDVSIPLPRPLGLLKWRFCMVKQEAEFLTMALVLPALAAVDWRRTREEDLRRKLREKDHVIAKLMDRIEVSGIDLSAVFPGFVGARKALSVRQAVKLVPGIEAFKEDEWEREGREEGPAGMKDILDALRDVGTGEMVWRGPMTTLGASYSNRQMEGKEIPRNLTKAKKPESLRHPAAYDDGSDSSDAKTKATTRPSPPNSSSDPVRSGKPDSMNRLKKLGTLGGMKSKSIPTTRKRSFSTSPETDGKLSKCPLVDPANSAFVYYSTNYDDGSDSSDAHTRAIVRPDRASSSSDLDHDQGSSQKPQLENLKPRKEVQGKPFTVTRKKSFSASPKADKRPQIDILSASTDTATEGDSEPESVADATAKSWKSNSRKPISKIGFIGGKKPQITGREKTRSPESTLLTSKTMPLKAKSKLGAIGGKKAKVADPPPPVDQEGETALLTPSPPPKAGIKQLEITSLSTPKPAATLLQAEPPLTEAERANQKRMELKRQLDEGAGKKKKRKF